MGVNGPAKHVLGLSYLGITLLLTGKAPKPINIMTLTVVLTFFVSHVFLVTVKHTPLNL